MHVINLEWTLAGISSNQTAALNQPAIVGRSPDCTVQIADASISRQHARIQAGSSGVKITNLSANAVVSINGTQSISQNGEGSLADGNFVMLGTVQVGVRIIVVPDGTTLDASCVNCGKSISSQVDICPWCGTSQSNPDANIAGHVTGMTF